MCISLCLGIEQDREGISSVDVLRSACSFFAKERGFCRTSLKARVRVWQAKESYSSSRFCPCFVRDPWYAGAFFVPATEEEIASRRWPISTDPSGGSQKMKKIGCAELLQILQDVLSFSGDRAAASSKTQKQTFTGSDAVDAFCKKLHFATKEAAIQVKRRATARRKGKLQRTARRDAGRRGNKFPEAGGEERGVGPTRVHHLSEEIQRCMSSRLRTYVLSLRVVSAAYSTSLVSSGAFFTRDTFMACSGRWGGFGST